MANEFCEKIDFVITWVDGADPQWLAERSKYETLSSLDGCSEVRFRDLGLMRYWFRGVETFAPWVNHIYFVTWGHYPEWLNIDHPKLTLIKHTDYIPKEFLPTYNSNVIELNLHRVSKLSEQFVLFNDDMFITDYVKPSEFYYKGLPCETVCLGQARSVDYRSLFPHTLLNNAAIINAHFDKKAVIRKHWNVFFSHRYGRMLRRNIIFALPRYFSAFPDMHVPSSHLKSTFSEIWEAEGEILEACGKNRFRTTGELSHWLMKNWRYCQGKVHPRSVNWGRYMVLGKNDQAIPAIKNQKYKTICLSDTYLDQDFEQYKQELIDAFETILPEKCSFEK